MARSSIYFAHANGFPASCYRKFLTALQDEYDIGYLDRIGHNQAFPVIDNWSILFQPRDLRYMREQLRFQTHMTAGGHLFPFEQPLSAAKELKQMFLVW